MQKRSKTNMILIIAFFSGLSLLLYPSFSDWWNSFHQSQAIASYSDIVNDLDAEKYEEIWQKATEYNAAIWGGNNGYYLSEELRAEYEGLLNVSGNGIMGYIDIPSIRCVLPIYHTADDSVLQVAVGHLEWTSLPVGGQNTHCVLSGHRGLPSAKLFTDLDKLSEGDTFLLHILNETLTYEVDRILIVDPDETEDLLIEEGKDYCTLVTCTPYGINSHRLLVRGRRVENRDQIDITKLSSDAVRIEPMMIALMLSIPLLFILLMAIVIGDKRKMVKRKNGGKDDAKEA